MSAIFNDHGIEIKLKESEDFLKVKETLTRIGVASKKEGTITQTCHILHKRGRYAILHFKEMFLLDGKEDTTAIEEEDYARRNAIAKLIAEWGLAEVVEVDRLTKPAPSMSQMKVIKAQDKGDWKLVSKYTIGKKSKEAQK